MWVDVDFTPMTSREEIKANARRVYPLDAHDLTEEQIAVAFAMTSRRPEPFDEIAQQVSQEKAADFHERWVLGYGHASVAEHAVVHLAVENISRVACDALEDNRLASYTEKSSRYQVMDQGYFHLPLEFQDRPELVELYSGACRGLFDGYQELIHGCLAYLKGENPQRERESDGAYGMRLRRIATDSCRAVLPASTLTNVGVTANARVLEHAISKLLSSGLAEERELGQDLLEQGRDITPTLIKYAERNPYFEELSEVQADLARKYLPEKTETSTERIGDETGEGWESSVSLAYWDAQAEEKAVAALLYKQSSLSYGEIWRQVLEMPQEARLDIVQRCLDGMGPHDAPPRELEVVDYGFEFVLDYGAYREFKRHRMMTYLPQPLTVDHGYRIPPLIVEAGLSGRFQEAVGPAEDAFRVLEDQLPPVAQYLVTHAHNRRVFAKLNLRECFHLFKLRTSQLAHFAIRGPTLQAMKLAAEKHPGLFRHLRLRDYPEWWQFQRPE